MNKSNNIVFLILIATQIGGEIYNNKICQLSGEQVIIGNHALDLNKLPKCGIFIDYNGNEYRLINGRLLNTGANFGVKLLNHKNLDDVETFIEELKASFEVRAEKTMEFLSYLHSVANANLTEFGNTVRGNVTALDYAFPTTPQFGLFIGTSFYHSFTAKFGKTIDSLPIDTNIEPENSPLSTLAIQVIRLFEHVNHVSLYTIDYNIGGFKAKPTLSTALSNVLTLGNQAFVTTLVTVDGVIDSEATLVYTPDNDGVTIDEFGLITGLVVGQTRITTTLTYENGTVSDVLVVDILESDFIGVGAITSDTSVILNPDDTTQITYEVSVDDVDAEDITVTNVVYTSSNTSVAEVNEVGLVTAKSVGIAKIIVTGTIVVNVLVSEAVEYVPGIPEVPEVPAIEAVEADVENNIEAVEYVPAIPAIPAVPEIPAVDAVYGTIEEPFVCNQLVTLSVVGVA